MTTTDSPLLRSYLTRLEAALSTVPADERRQIVDGVEEHAAIALSELPAPTEADLRNVLSRLGDPETIAREARDRLGVTTSWRTKLSRALLLFGAVVGIFDLVAVSSSQVGPVEFALLAVPVVVLVVLAVGLRHQVQQPT